MRPRRMVRSAATTMIIAMAMAVGAGCGPNTEGSKLLTDADAGKLTIGVRFDGPGLGARAPDGHLVGFDIDVATYIAGQLGVRAENINWQEVISSNREKALADGEVDMVVSTYSITPERQNQVSFAGPYFVAGQDLLTHRSDTDINGPQSIGDKRLCAVKGSTSARKIRDMYGPHAQLVQYDRSSRCVEALLANDVDAFTNDDVILAGFASEFPEVLKVVGQPFSTERYGVGLAKNDTAGRSRVAGALRKMIQSGAWRNSLQRNVGASGYRIPDAPKITNT